MVLSVEFEEPVLDVVVDCKLCSELGSRRHIVLLVAAGDETVDILVIDRDSVDSLDDLVDGV